MIYVSAVLMQNKHWKRRQHSPMPDACQSFRHASLHVKQFSAVQLQADHG